MTSDEKFDLLVEAYMSQEAALKRLMSELSSIQNWELDSMRAE